ncbi:Fungal transcriptional regulatory protein [Cordyceps fumosorosea ARSEF 2679]|uniref:Fungal transcriptional regulatory protein n=1 Tax=Cordyceps fumosorosea (strain ARSEF 2679) TaxID=1081104 RepID=A0A167U9Q9_CORFA|nr:Fungal transcriptional regulatory protein [Cordyceps fumosorosea ARSEF 2679]OAA61361.1 Fungal transcriptional regulatory protein [Cordyceps fumosorosea ARSEF 2679]
MASHPRGTTGTTELVLRLASLLNLSLSFPSASASSGLCDETKPFCNRCRKSKRQCPGYPVPRLYNDGRKPTKKGTTTSSDLSSSSDEDEFFNDHWRVHAAQRAAAASSSLDSTIKIPLQDAASCHFLSNWVLLPPEGTNRGFFEFLLPIQKKATRGSPFYLAFKACALSSLTQKGFDPTIERQATSYYVKALAATTDALSRPSVATSDATLATVMLLGLYEIQSASGRGVEGWVAHASGSMQLMNSRSWKKLNTDLGMSIFVAVRVNLILLGLLQGKPPPTSSEWWGKGTFKDKYALVGLHLSTLTTEVRHQLDNLLDLEYATLDDFDQLSAIMKKCQVLEAHCRGWPDTLPEYFKFNIAAWISHPPTDPAKSEALFGPVHSYSDPWVGAIWNMVRTSRLILLTSILRCSALIHERTDVKTLPEYPDVAKLCIDVIHEAIAGVPYQLGWFKNRTALLPTMPSYACGQNGAQSTLAAFTAMFPLTSIRDHELATDEQRVFAEARLQFMAHNLGLRSAAFVEKAAGWIPSAAILKDFDSRSAMEWRRLRAEVSKAAAAAEPLKNIPVGDATVAPVEDAATGNDRACESSELPVRLEPKGAKEEPLPKQEPQ